MDEEIVVDDIDENSVTETQQVDDPATPVMPLLYIQQNKLRSNQSANANQTLVSSGTQLTAIINPVNNQVITWSTFHTFMYNGMHTCLALGGLFRVISIL